MMKRKKNTRQRGTHTHGWGSKKKHRGAGNRGGRGKAGSGKRGDAKKPSFWKNSKPKGFSSLKKSVKTINISELHKFSETNIDLGKIGYAKLLGKGIPDRKYELNIFYASESAIEKIEKAGGSVFGLQIKKTKVSGQSQTIKESAEADNKTVARVEEE